MPHLVVAGEGENFDDRCAHVFSIPRFLCFDLYFIILVLKDPPC